MHACMHAYIHTYIYIHPCLGRRGSWWHTFSGSNWTRSGWVFVTRSTQPQKMEIPQEVNVYMVSIIPPWHQIFLDWIKLENPLARGRQLCTQLSIIKGPLEEMLRFWRCQVQKLRRSRRIAAFLMLPSWKPEDMSHNSFVFKLAERQIDRQTDR